MKLANGEEMQRIDSMAINEFKIPGIVLMERAALWVTQEILDSTKSLKEPVVTIFAGVGNNGGDGLAIGRQLTEKGIQTKIVLVGKQERLRGDARVNLDCVIALQIPLEEVHSEEDIIRINEWIDESDIIVDSIFGTGLSRNIAGYRKTVIERINQSSKYTLSVDIPSGIHGNTGRVMGAAIRAHKTVTFSIPKKGLFLFPGAEYAGEIVVGNIGIPKKVLGSQELKCNVLLDEEMQQWLPKRQPRTNKGTYGKIQLIAGSKGMTGAAVLASKAAYKSGGGLVNLFVPESIHDIMQMQLTEIISTPVPEANGMISQKSIKTIAEYMEKATVIAIGPGLGKNDEIYQVMEFILENAAVPVIIDADGLNTIARNIEIIKKAKSPVILTPHPGEMSRLCGISIKQILEDPLEIVREYSVQWNTIVVLKDNRTIIGHPDGQVYINTTGNPGMATAGSGDVLTGIIAGLVGQKIDPYKAAVMGVFIHGKAGDLGSKRLGEYGLMASDICNHIPYVLKDMDQLMG